MPLFPISQQRYHQVFQCVDFRINCHQLFLGFALMPDLKQ